MILQTISCEVRRWTGDPRGPFFSFRLYGGPVARPIDVPLVYGTNVHKAARHLLAENGLIEKGQLLGEAGYRLAITSDVEVTRRRMLHDYGIGELT